jgi:hypothetical protein
MYPEQEQGEQEPIEQEPREQDKDDVVVESFSWKEVRALAREFESAGTFALCNGSKPRATESQRRDVLRACRAAIDGTIDVSWIREAATTTRDSKPTENAYGYFLTVLREICASHNADLSKTVAAIRVPESLCRPNNRPGT